MAINNELVKRQIMVGRVSKMRDDGLSSVEIAEKLNIPESTVRSCINTITKADANRAKMNGVG